MARKGRKKRGGGFKKFTKGLKKGVKIAGKVATVGGEVLEEVGKATGQEELVALGAGVEAVGKATTGGIQSAEQTQRKQLKKGVGLQRAKLARAQGLGGVGVGSVSRKPLSGLPGRSAVGAVRKAGIRDLALDLTTPALLILSDLKEKLLIAEKDFMNGLSILDDIQEMVVKIERGNIDAGQELLLADLGEDLLLDELNETDGLLP